MFTCGYAYNVNAQSEKRHIHKSDFFLSTFSFNLEIISRQDAKARSAHSAANSDTSTRATLISISTSISTSTSTSNHFNLFPFSFLLEIISRQDAKARSAHFAANSENRIAKSERRIANGVVGGG